MYDIYFCYTYICVAKLHLTYYNAALCFTRNIEIVEIEHATITHCYKVKYYLTILNYQNHLLKYIHFVSNPFIKVKI